MALYATNRFPGDGTTTSYEFNFVGKYIARTHVKVYQENNETKVRTSVSINDSNFLNDTTLRSLPVTPVGSTLVIYRETPKPPLVDFVNGSRFTEYNMDLVARQGLFVAMEAMDAGDRQQLLEIVAAVVDLEAAAAASAAIASARRDEIARRYLGSRVSPPTTDDHGGPLLTGALYWDTVLPGMRSWNGSMWVTLPAATKASVGLDKVDNTRDVDKPISNATRTALDGTVKTTGDQTIAGNKTFSASRIYQNAYSIGFELGPGVGTGDTNTQGFYVAAGKALWFGSNAGGGTMTLDVRGNVTATGNVTAYSDIRLKTDFTKITDALSKVSRLNGYTYTRNDTGARQTGVVAQELQEVLPEAVIDNGKYLAVAYGNIVGLLIEAIKELKAEVDQLKGE